MGLKLQERKNMEASLNSRDSHFQNYVQKLSHLAAATRELQHDSLQAAAVHRLAYQTATSLGSQHCPMACRIWF